MLWKKETRRADALYTDIFTPCTQHWDAKLNSFLQTNIEIPHPQKSNAIALQKRNMGNKMFRECAWLRAIDLYNDSLRFAVPGSEHISLAYANRAACFLNLKMYDECLADIELATKAGYPEHLQSKLNERKIKCLKQKQEDPQNQPKLSIDPNEKFPCLSNKAKVQRKGKKCDYSVVADADIDVGQPIVIEDPYQTSVWIKFGTHCNICAADVDNLVPCEKCTSAMFCSKCKGHFLHKYECGLNFCSPSNFNSETMRLVRSILLVIELFPSADELLAFVERILKKNELPDSLLDDRSRYHAYFNNPVKPTTMPIDHVKLEIYSTYKTLLRIPHVDEMFKTTKRRRFLMHLIGHHKDLLELGAGISVDNVVLDQSIAPVHVSPVMQSYFKHSCDPNVHNFTNGGKHIMHSIKPIKKGEQLFITHAEREIESMRSTKERKDSLLSDFKINCECSRCQGKVASPEQRQKLASEPEFRYIESNETIIHPLEFNGNEAKQVMAACVKLLRQHGQIGWCRELYVLLKVSQRIYRCQLKAGGRDFTHPLVHAFLWYQAESIE